MSFDVGADAYTRFMGRYSEPLAVAFAALIDPVGVDQALDVGCGPGAMTAELVRLLGSTAVSAVEPFVAAARARSPSSTSGVLLPNNCRSRTTALTSRLLSWSCISGRIRLPGCPR